MSKSRTKYNLFIPNIPRRTRVIVQQVKVLDLHIVGQVHSLALQSLNAGLRVSLSMVHCDSQNNYT